MDRIEVGANVTPQQVFWWGLGTSAAAAFLVSLRDRARRPSSQGASPAEPEPTFRKVADVPPFRLTQAEILNAALENRLEFRWTELPGYPGVWVFEDAAKLDGIRVPVSPRTTQAIADALQLSPTTALVEDAVYNAATVRLKPVAFPVADQAEGVASVPDFNADLDRQIARQTLGRPGWGLVASVGKSWVLSNLVLEHPGRAVNYGFHWPATTTVTSRGPWPSVDGRSKVFQQPGWAHGLDHVDYSQTLRLCRLDSGAALPSHEPLRINRLWVSP